jgi:hypothetical protein
MTSVDRPTVVGVFHEQDQARKAIEELRGAGFRDDQIGYIAQDTRDTSRAVSGNAEETPAEETRSEVATGAVAGGVIGGVVGAATALLIPGLGPALAGGILIATLGGAALGAAAGGLAGALANIGVPEEEAHYYQSEFSAGRTLVTVQASERAAEASAILQRNGAYDASTRAAAPTASDYQPETSGSSADEASDTMAPPSSSPSTGL